MGIPFSGSLRRKFPRAKRKRNQQLFNLTPGSEFLSFVGYLNLSFDIYSAAYMALVFSPKNADKEAPPALCVLYVISRHLLFSLEAGKLNEQKMFSLNLMIDRFLYWCAFSRAGKILQEENQKLKEKIGGRPKDSVMGRKLWLIVEELNKMKSEGFQVGGMSMESLANEIRKRNRGLRARAPSTLKKQLTKIKKDVDMYKIFAEGD